MVLLDRGHVVAVGPLAELQADPASMPDVLTGSRGLLQGVIVGFEERFGLLRVSVPGGDILVPSTSGSVGDVFRIRILAADVALARDPPGRNSTLNVLPARIVATDAPHPHEILASIALGEDGAGRAASCARAREILGGAWVCEGPECLRPGQVCGSGRESSPE